MKGIRTRKGTLLNRDIKGKGQRQLMAEECKRDRDKYSFWHRDVHSFWDRDKNKERD